jgi:hypothetical protein
MDRRRAFAAFCGLILLGAAGRSILPPEANWIAAERRQAALLAEPVECVSMPAGPDARRSVLAGRVAFRTPVLLGGQAARVGLSCASCHRNGRGNADFSFGGLSGAPGTADVTSSLMSRVRGDGNFNPVRIPDLAFDPPKKDRDPAKPVLRAFIRGLIVDEFDGREPPPAVLDGLTAYVRALGPRQCVAGATVPLDANRELADAASAVDAALTFAASGDSPTARLMLSGARAALGRVDSRYVGLPREQKRLARLDDGLRDLQLALDHDRNIAPDLKKWRTQLKSEERYLVAAMPRSLYNAPRLEVALH